MKKIKGLSLIEVLVTIVITSIGLMGLVSLQMQAIKSTHDSGNRSQAIWIFNDIINRIHANEVASASYVTEGQQICSPANTASLLSTKCSNYHTGDSSVVNGALSNCTSEDLAAWDLYEVTCGTPKSVVSRETNDGLKSAQTFGNAITYLPESNLTITCVNLPCTNGGPLNITLQWRAKADDESITGAQRTADSGLLTLTDVITP